jgi:hypothetical protein
MVQDLRAKDLQSENEYPAIFDTVLNSRSDCSFYPNRPARLGQLNTRPIPLE